MTTKFPKSTPTLRAIISVSDKTGIVQFAHALDERGVEILSTGGTAGLLIEHGINVIKVDDYTGFPEMMDGRVKTLHPKVHGGILGRRGTDDAVMVEYNIPPIDLVCVNLYPFEETIAKPDCDLATAIENIDIGGPTMLRAAAKNHASVTVIVSSDDYQPVLDEMNANKGCLTDETRFKLATTAFEHTARYDGLIANYLGSIVRNGKVSRVGTLVRHLKYGENAWQEESILSTCGSNDPLAIDSFTLKNERVPGYINCCDIDRILQTITHIAAAFDIGHLPPYIAVAVKHGNACGAGIGRSPSEALHKMITGDPLAIFGGVVMTNFQITADELDCLRTYKQPTGNMRMLAAIIAPKIYDGAVEALQKSRCILAENAALGSLSHKSLDTAPIKRQVRGGKLEQPNHTFLLDLKSDEVHFSNDASPKVKRDILLAWAIGSTSTSNTITIVRDGQLLGNGTGQQDRVKAAELAVDRANRSDHNIHGATAYSDSFFPFPDGVDVLIEAGVSTIFASSGSNGDDAVKAHCAEAGITLCMMPDSLCRGFYGH